MASRSSLLVRLNLWYGAMVTMTVILALVAAELLSSYLARQQQIELFHRVQSEVRRQYAETGPSAAAHVEVPGTVTELMDDEGHSLGQQGRWPDTPVLVTVTQLGEGVWLRTGIPDAALQEARQDARLGLVGGGGMALLVALGGGIWVTRRSLRPIDQLVLTARQIIESGDEGQRVPASRSGDQLDDLVVLFNALLDRNARLVESMRQSLDNVGHDLRTPLTRIQAAAELALASEDTDEHIDSLETCLEEAIAAHELLTALLDLTTAEAGMMRIERQPLSLREVIRRTQSLYQHVAEDRGVQLVVEDGADATVAADPMRLQQAAANVVDNALKFSDAGSAITLSVVRDGAQAGIQVQDHGCGIDPADLPHLFDRLFRADSSRATPGAGLGMAMVKAILDAHGGRVAVQSQPDRGTTVTLWLDVAGTLGKATAPSSGADPAR